MCFVFVCEIVEMNAALNPSQNCAKVLLSFETFETYFFVNSVTAVKDCCENVEQLSVWQNISVWKSCQSRKILVLEMLTSKICKSPNNSACVYICCLWLLGKKLK